MHGSTAEEILAHPRFVKPIRRRCRNGWPHCRAVDVSERCPYVVSANIRPIRFFWIQAIWHSRTEESFAMTRRKRDGTKAGFSTSMAAPSAEIFRTVQL